MVSGSRALKVRRSSSSVIKPGELVDIVELKKLTMNDRRIYNMLIDNAWDTITEDRTHEISKQVLGHSKHKSYDRIGESIERLMGAMAKVRIKQDGETAFLRVQLLGPNTEQTRKDGIISYTFSKQLRDIVRDSQIFARLQREVMYQLTSKYSLVLYEMIQKRGNQRFIREQAFEVDELRDILVQPGRLTSWINFRNKALDPAIREVSAMSDYDVSYDVRKQGRKITHVILKWRRKDEHAANATQRELDQPRVGRKARIEGTSEEIVGQSEYHIPPLSTGIFERAKEMFPRYDAYAVESAWREWAATKNEPVKNPEGAFLNFFKRYAKENPVQDGGGGSKSAGAPVHTFPQAKVFNQKSR